MLKRAVAYSRVSSKEQEKEGFSIPAQQKLLREYAKKHDIEIVREFADAETAKSAGREQFGEMVKYLRKAKGVKVILVEKTDRLYRNFRDYVQIGDHEFEVHLVKEGEVLHKDSKSHQKFIHGIKVLMAKNFIDNLSEEVKKGLFEKASNGQYVGQAPTGYINDREARIIRPDPDRAPLVRQLYEKYATGRYSIDSLHAWAKDAGLWSKYGKPLSRANVEKVLKNPVYYGDFMYGGTLYQGTHEPIVSRELWEDVQRAFRNRGYTGARRRMEFAFTGLLECVECGCAITAEIKKERYIYYHCSKMPRKDCAQRSNHVREEALNEQFAEILRTGVVPRDVIDQVRDGLKASCTQKSRFRDEEVASLRRKIDVLKARLEQSYLDKLDGRIDEAFWQRNANAWRRDVTLYETKLEALDRAEGSYYEEGVKIIELMQNAPALYLRATQDEKRRLIDLFLSNLRLNGATIEYNWRSPFHLPVKWASLSTSAQGQGFEPR